MFLQMLPRGRQILPDSRTAINVNRRCALSHLPVGHAQNAIVPEGDGNDTEVKHAAVVKRAMEDPRPHPVRQRK